MIDITHTMKGIIYLGAAVALLRSAAAFLPNNNDQHDIHDQLVFEPAKGANRAINAPAVSTEYVDAGIPTQRSHGVPPPSLEQTPPLKDVNLTPHLPPHQRPNFTIGSPTSQWAITYTPYTSTLSCVSPSTIRSDIATIARKGFTSIRLYSIDCSALRHIGHAALTHGLKMIIGIPLDDGFADAETQLSDLISWASNSNSTTNSNSNTDTSSRWDLIEMVVIGNEAIFNNQTTAPALAAFITTTRTTLRSTNYAGPITTTEPLPILTQHLTTLCPTLDIAAANIQPFFHSSVTASTAGAFVASELARLATLCPGPLSALNLETGWPSRGRANGDAVPGSLEQWTAVAGIMESAGGRSVVLGFGDEGWRDGGEFGVERSWGCGHVFGGGGGLAGWLKAIDE